MSPFPTRVTLKSRLRFKWLQSDTGTINLHFSVPGWFLGGYRVLSFTVIKSDLLLLYENYPGYLPVNVVTACWRASRNDVTNDARSSHGTASTWSQTAVKSPVTKTRLQARVSQLNIVRHSYTHYGPIQSYRRPAVTAVRGRGRVGEMLPPCLSIYRAGCVCLRRGIINTELSILNMYAPLCACVRVGSLL